MDSKNPFEQQSVSVEQKAKILEIMTAANALYEVLKTLPVGRETSLAVTKLEEAAMWANKSVAFNS